MSVNFRMLRIFDLFGYNFYFKAWLKCIVMLDNLSRYLKYDLNVKITLHSD